MKHTATLKLAFALACAIGSGAALADAPTLRFGLEAQYPPFESKAPNGDLQGFDIDVGNAVCQTAKLSCKWVETSFDGLIPALKGRKFDAINSAMNATEQRRQAIDFTTIIYRVPTQLIARTGSGLLPTPESLKGKRVGVLQASIQETFAKAHWEPAASRSSRTRTRTRRMRIWSRAASTRRSCSRRPASAASCRARTARASRSSASRCTTTRSSAAASRSACARATMR